MQGFMTTFGREVYLGPNSTIVDVCPGEYSLAISDPQ
jgi:hypothetical protein